MSKKSKMKIIHINQRHKLEFGIIPTPEKIAATIRSQFQIAQELKKYPRSPILLESLYEDALDASSLPFSHVAKMVFPKGFPKNFDDLNSLQKDFLYDQGAVLILFYIGEIPMIYKSINKETSAVIDKSIFEGDYGQIFAAREIEVIKCAKEAAIKQFETLDDRTVIIVFGAAHNLKPYCDKEDFEYELINTTHSYQEDLESLSSYQEDLESLSSYQQELESLSSYKQANKISDRSLRFEPSFKKIDENDLLSLNQRLDKVPGDIATRIKRAKIYLNQSNYQKALEDYTYVNKKYPANLEAANGIKICTQHLESEKSFSKSSQKKQTAFFAPDPTTTSQKNIVPIELQHALNSTGVLKNCITKGYVTMEELIEMHKSKPWVIGALRCSNIYNGICNNYITIDQLEGLSQEQVSSLKHEFKDEELQATVENYIKQNRNQI